MSEFGAVLRNFRRGAGLSQEKLAEASGVSVEAVKTLEAGRRRHPRPQTVTALANGLGLTENERAELVAAGTRIRSAKQVPEQLPDDLQDFAGRGEQVAEVENLFLADDARHGVVVVSAIAGMGGIGKTALGVHVGHRVADRFPDGQLYVNLRGFGPGEPMTAVEALGRLMDSLGVQVEASASVDELSARYRSALAGQRVFVFLDNAASETQVLPLLPGSSTCAVLITSRRSLIRLPGAAHLALDTLPEQEALLMLDQVVGGGRIAADPDGAKAVVRLCGGLPLALRIAGARLAAQPSWSVADFVERLESSRRRLDELAIGDLDVRSSIEVSLAAATEADEAAAAAFRLLGLHEGEELDVRVAARMLELPVSETETHLERLVDLHLLEARSPRRYRMHDLVRRFVQDTTDRLTTPEDRAAARLRVLRFYLAMAWGFRSTRYLGPMTADWSDETWAADTEAMTAEEYMLWFDEEIGEIIAAARRAVTGPPAERELVARITVGLNPYFVARRRSADGVTLGTLALAAEATVNNPIAAFMVRYDLSVHYTLAGLHAQAVEQITAALAAPAVLEYDGMHMTAQTYLGEFLENAGRDDEAIAAALRSVAGAQRRGNDSLEAEGRLVLGKAAGRQGRRADQDREFRRAAELIRVAGDAQEKFLTMRAIGASYRETGRLDDSLMYLEEGREVVQGTRNGFMVAEVEEELGLTQLARGALDLAEKHLLAALDAVRGNWELESRVRRALGQVHRQAGRPGEARSEWERALELAARHGAPRAEELRELLEEIQE